MSNKTPNEVILAKMQGEEVISTDEAIIMVREIRERVKTVFDEMEKGMAENCFLLRDIQKLTELAKKTLKFMSDMGEAPYFITSPSIRIVRDYAEIINKYNLL